MTDSAELNVQVAALPDGDDEELAGWTLRLRAELLELDVDDVTSPDEDAPDQSKGLGTALGALVVRLASRENLRKVARAIGNFAARTNKTVKISYTGSDVLELTGVTAEQHDKIIDAWIAKQTPGA
jgi:hypothetical protein